MNANGYMCVPEHALDYEHGAPPIPVEELPCYFLEPLSASPSPGLSLLL